MNCVDREGRAIDLNTWGTLWKTPGYREIGKEEYSNGELLSTVYIGVPLQFLRLCSLERLRLALTTRGVMILKLKLLKGILG